MRKPKTFSIRFWIRKNHQKKNGEYPIYARINIDGLRADLSLHISAKEKQWCSKSERLRSRSLYAKDKNKHLDDVFVKLMNCYNQLHNENVPITAKSIKSRYLGRDKKLTSLSELLQYHKERELDKLRPGTAKNYSATETYIRRYLKTYLKVTDLSLANIDYAFVVDFEHFLRHCKPIKSCQPLSNNGIMKHMERLKRILNVGYRFGWLKKNSFERYSLKFEEYDSAFLEKDELLRLESVYLNDYGLDLVRNLFVFSCYTGLGYAEVKSLKQGDITKGVDGDDWIHIRRQKTNTPKIPLLEKARNILDHYKDHPLCNENNTLLPVYSNQKVNQYLKKIAKSLNIGKHLTFHVARHTFATTITLMNDVPLETVSKLLGHTKISTTQRYARVIEKKISKDMERLKKNLKSSQSSSKSKQTQYSHLRIVQ